MADKQITVTSLLLLDLDEFNAMLKEIWTSKRVTGNGNPEMREPKVIYSI